MPPHLGQGGNTALEDAGILSELIEKFPGVPQKAFKLYESLRMKRVYGILRNATLMGKMKLY